MNKIHSAHVHFFRIPLSLPSKRSPILCPVLLKVERFCLPFCLLHHPQISIARLCPVTGANDNKTHSFRFCYSSSTSTATGHCFIIFDRFHSNNHAPPKNWDSVLGAILICSQPIICRGSHSMASQNHTRTKPVLGTYKIQSNLRSISLTQRKKNEHPSIPDPGLGVEPLVGPVRTHRGQANLFTIHTVCH